MNNTILNGVAQTQGGALFGQVIYCSSSTSVLGDSIMEYGQVLPAPTTTNSTGSYSNSHVGWFNSLMAVNNVGLDVTGFYAVPGVPLESIIANQLPLALADSSQVSWLHGGINNLNSTIQNDPVATIISLFQTIISQLASAKKAVIVDSLNPVSQSGSTGAAARAYQIPMINAAVRAICAQYANVIFNDTYDVMVDPTSLLANPLANMVRTDDGIHFVSNGARAVGYASFANIAPRLNISKYKTPGTNLLSSWSGTGGTTTVGTGSVTGTPPVGWNVQVASGSAAVTIGTLAPDMISLAITNTGGSASSIYIQATNNAALVAAIGSAGATVQGGFNYQVNGNVLLNRLCASIRYNSSNLVYGMGQSANEPTITYPQVAGGGRINTPPFALPGTPTLTNLEFIMQINVGATTGATTVCIFNPTLNTLS